MVEQRHRWIETFLTSICGILFVVSPASAFEVSILGPTSATIVSGGAFSIDLAIDNLAMDNVGGFDVSINGLQAAGVDVTAGASALDYLNEGCVVDLLCFGGKQSTSNAFFDPTDLTLHFDLGDDSLLAVDTHSPGSTSQDGSIDLGIPYDLATLTPSPLDVHVEMIASTVGVHVLTIDSQWYDSDLNQIVPLAQSTFTLTVIPEPGTFVLLSLGLIGLAASSPSRSRVRTAPRRG